LLNDTIKKLILILLLVVNIYLIYLILPFIATVLNFIIKILIPFVIAFALAFILQPLVNFFQMKGLKRGLAVAVVLFTFLAAIVLTLTLTLPHLIAEVKLLINKVPIILEDAKKMIDDFANNFNFLPENFQPNYQNLNGFLNKYIIKLENFPQLVLNKVTSIIGTLILVPMILIYFLLDYERLLNLVRNYLIKHDKIRFKNYLGELNKVMGSYFRGVFLVMIILSVAFAIAFYIIGLDFALFFGLIIGITNVIPYLGSYIGAAFPFLFALSESPQKAILVVIISIILQTLESDLLTPYVQSKQVKIHPLIVILGLLVFGSLFGIIGMMIAVPILSIIKITLKHYPLRIKKKRL